MIPVNPPKVNNVIKPSTHIKLIDITVFTLLYILVTQEKTLIPVGIAITMVAEVKYARVSKSIPTVNIWCAQTMQPITPILTIA